MRTAAALFGEAVRSALAQRTGSIVTVLIVAAVTAVILGTTGQTAAAERDVLQRIDDAGSRTLVVSDAQNSGLLTRDLVERISRLSSVEWAVGLGTAEDGQNTAMGAGGQRVPVWAMVGAPPASVFRGPPDRDVRLGEGLAGPAAAAALSTASGMGSVELQQDRQAPLVGRFAAEEPLAFLEEGVVVASGDQGPPLRSLHVAATTPAQAGELSSIVLALIDADDPQALRVQSPQALAHLRAAVAGELGRYGRGILLAVLGVGLVLVSGSVAGQVLLRRKDLGRRRALGASRATVVALIVAQTAVVAIVGALLGAGIGLGLLRRSAGVLPAPGFVAGVLVLVCLSSLIAALPPAVGAATRDPVRVLRTP